MSNNLTREEHLTALASAIKTYADSRLATIGGGASYTLPTASATQKGGIIPGAGLSMAGDTLNVVWNNFAIGSISSTVNGAFWLEDD